MNDAGKPDLSKPYDPREVESRWYDRWEKSGVFEATDDPNDTRPVYVVPMPPPNVTGSLHMGHAQRDALEDALVRYHRMCGYNTLWQPGIDHAGIATQTVVERQLLREGKTRHDIGREAFVERVWKWKAESGGRILQQKRVLGGSPDWRRSKFTMDPDMSRAVTEAFVRLYDEGLMYRATRLINWCPECRTALSDLEVENEEGANGELFEFAYKVDGSDGEIVVATTRPETMLGDTAVAVHPDDPRYKHLHGRKLVHPFVDRKIPIITDAILVDPKFGTGAVKVTPAHDFNDFATGKRHKLEEINIFELDGTLNANGGPFKGMDRKEARRAVKKALDDKGLARGSKPHTLTLPRCQRSGGIVEPMISTQWFLQMKAMAESALEAVRQKRVAIIPPEWEKTYDHFLSNIQDWCVSRQLWWGHQIPAWHGPNGEIRVARTRPAECGGGWRQDPDVLDTWFSSALWPFSTLGWPDDTPALRKFYPTNPKQTSDLETGYDILFFWVARMIMFGLHFTKEVPFRRVLLSGLIVDETGEKMSKVKGNVIDPLDLIQGTKFEGLDAEAMTKLKKAYPSIAQMPEGFPAFGADAVRFTLATYPPSNMRIALAPKRIEGNRHFLNKIWNATRLSLELMGDATIPREPPKATAPFNRWILSRLSEAARIARQGIETFRIDEATGELYRFFWYDFCDWYLEHVAKRTLRDEKADHRETAATVGWVLDCSLRLLHPYAPFITEELWQRLHDYAEPFASICLQAYPSPTDTSRDEDLEAQIERARVSAEKIREGRATHNVHPSERPRLSMSRGPAAAALFGTAEPGGDNPFVAVLTSATGSVWGGIVDAPPSDGYSVGVSLPRISGTATFHTEVKIDPAQERSRLERELKRIDKDLAAVERKLSSRSFSEKAPPEIVRESHAQKAALEKARATIVAELEKLAP